MKLAKKMLVSVLALAMVAALALTAFAAAPVVTMTASNAYVGEEVTITVNASGITGLESADLELFYDADILEFVSVAKGDAAYSLEVGGNPTAGSATYSFAFVEASTADAAALCVYTFKVLKEGDANLNLKFNSWDGTDEPAEVTATVKATVKPVVTPDPDPAPAETTTGNKGGNGGKIDQTGETSVAIIAGVMAVAAVAFVATRKKEEQ